MRSVSAPDSRTKAEPRLIACTLGVTGKRLRRALPPVAPPAQFRAQLWLLLDQRESEKHGGHEDKEARSS